MRKIMPRNVHRFIPHGGITSHCNLRQGYRAFAVLDPSPIVPTICEVAEITMLSLGIIRVSFMDRHRILAAGFNQTQLRVWDDDTVTNGSTRCLARFGLSAFFYC